MVWLREVQTFGALVHTAAALRGGGGDGGGGAPLVLGRDDFAS